MANLCRYLLGWSVSMLLIFVVACSSDNEERAGTTNPNTGVRNPGTGSALSLPLSLLNNKTKTNVTSQQLSLYKTRLIQTTAVAGSEYQTDPVDESQLGDSNIAMNFANTLLCISDLVNATGKVNQGVFVVDVSSNVCNTAVQGDTVNTGSTIQLVINSTRENDQSPQYIQMWLKDHFDMIYYANVVEFVIYESVSADKPYGHFDVNYSTYFATSDSVPLSDWVRDQQASIRSTTSSVGLPRFEFLVDVSTPVANGTDEFAIKSVTEITSSDFQDGQSRMSFNYAGPNFSGSSATESIFNGDFSLEMISDSASIDTCYSRINIIKYVWGYNLYDAITEQRIPTQIESALDVVYTDSQGNAYNLSYLGPGMLYGIPSNSLTGFDEFVLADGSKLVDSSGNEYISKGVFIVYAPEVVDISFCSVFDRAAPSANQNLDLAHIPGMQAPSVGLTDWPAVN